jgi:hypothetical protein
MTKPEVAFISGHIDLTSEQFDKYYVKEIDDAIAKGCNFVVGNALGCDAMALQYLKEKVDSNRVTVYHRESPYDKVNKQHLTMNDIKKLGYKNILTGYSSFDQRDAHMTEDSDFDIAWVRPDHETKLVVEALGKVYRPGRVSGTLKNIHRRSKQLLAKKS